MASSFSITRGLFLCFYHISIKLLCQYIFSTRTICKLIIGKHPLRGIAYSRMLILINELAHLAGVFSGTKQERAGASNATGGVQ